MAPSFSGRRRIEITESERNFMPGNNNNCTSLQEQSGLPVMCARAWCSFVAVSQHVNHTISAKHRVIMMTTRAYLQGRHKLASSSLSMTDLFLVLFLQEANYPSSTTLPTRTPLAASAR